MNAYSLHVSLYVCLYACLCASVCMYACMYAGMHGCWHGLIPKPLEGPAEEEACCLNLLMLYDANMLYNMPHGMYAGGVQQQ